MEIEKDKSYATYLNQYDVIHIDMAEMWSNVGKKEELFLSAFNKTILLAYYHAREYYNIIREVPFGKGYADLVFIPKKNKDVPAMIIELKYDKSPKEAISQIKERKYMEGMQEYQGNMLLVGINYDRKTKKHSCAITEW